MDYIRLPELINTYPQPGNYIRQSKDKTALFGIYSDVNKLEFDLPNIDDIKIVNNTTFRFIVGIRKNSSDKDVKYYTSRRFMLDLRESQQEGNPYFSKFAVLNSYIVFVEWETFDLLFGDIVPIEFKQGVLMQVNNCIQKETPTSQTTFINYELLVKYIDWVVSPPSPNELGSDGVIPAYGLGGWYEGNYNPTKGYFEFNEAELAQSQGTGLEPDYGKKSFQSDPKIKYQPFGVKGKDLEFKKVEKSGIYYYWNESLQFWQKYGLEEPPKVETSAASGTSGTSGVSGTTGTPRNPRGGNGPGGRRGGL